jgi:hypothetical protein
LKYLQLIWDFKGPDAAPTAQHHLIHLNEYTKANQIKDYEHGVKQLSDLHHYAYVVVSEADMPTLRDQLKPHRGKLWTPTEK